MKSTADKAAFLTSVVVRIAGEDLKPGDFVTALTEMIELPSFLWCCDSAAAPKDELVRLRYLPREAVRQLNLNRKHLLIDSNSIRLPTRRHSCRYCRLGITQIPRAVASVPG